MAISKTTFMAELTGIRPLMFDRYAGDNSTQLPVAEKMYLDRHQGLIIPAINIYSLLAAENTKSVCRQFFGKNGKTIALGISSYTAINPMEIPVMDSQGQVMFRGWNDQIRIVKHVARLKNGIPNPKERPVVDLPWRVELEIEYMENKYCTAENLRQAFAMGGTLGLGTFRPYFGRYDLTSWSER